jgi:hypothetical protein
MLKKIEQLIPYIALGFIFGAVLFLVQQCNSRSTNNKTVYVEKTKTVIDTHTVIGKTPDPIVITKQVFIERIDTLYLDKKDIIVNPFKVCYDTIIKPSNDTINFCYSYPQEQLFLALKKAPPIIQVITIHKDNYVEQSDWNKILYFVAGAGSMYLSQELLK